MRKNPVNWGTVKSINVRGEEYDSIFPDLISKSYKGELLNQILLMPRKKSVSFESAVRTAQQQFMEAFDRKRVGYEAGECLWYAANFVEWISGLGYHIEFTGDEFEGFFASDKAS